MGRMGSYGAMWGHVGSCGVVCGHVGSCGILWGHAGRTMRFSLTNCGAHPSMKTTPVRSQKSEKHVTMSEP
eukprot:5798054-Prymnesium_polylepis.1